MLLLYFLLYIYFFPLPKMVVTIQKGENVIGYVIGFDDAKRVPMVAIKMVQNYLKKNESKAQMVRSLGLRFFLLKVFFW